MARYAVIVGGIVDNVVEADADYASQMGWVQSDVAGPGWLWDGESFAPPPPAPAVVPSEVSARQAVQALIHAGLIDAVQPAIEGIADPVQRALAQAEWDRSQVFRRDRPLLIQLATAMGLSSEQLDQLFIAAAGL